MTSVMANLSDWVPDGLGALALLVSIVSARYSFLATRSARVQAEAAQRQTEIEHQRRHDERRPTWDAKVEPERKDERSFLLSLVLTSREAVDSVTVRLLSPEDFLFTTDQPASPASRRVATLQDRLRPGHPEARWPVRVPSHLRGHLARLQIDTTISDQKWTTWLDVPLPEPTPRTDGL